MDWVIAGVYLATIAYTMYMQSKLRASATSQTIQGPTASEGVPIPVIFGTRQITNPNVCWYGNQQDEKSGDVHYYSLDAQIVLCHGKIDKLIDIVVNGKRTMWRTGPSGLLTDPVDVEGTVVNAGQIGVHPDSTKFAMDAVVHLGAGNAGGTDAGVSDDLASAMGFALGPRYKGVAWLFGHFRLGTSPMFSPVECIVQRIHTRNAGKDVQWYDAKAEITSGRSLGDLWKYKLQAAADDSDWSGVSYDDSAWSQAAGPISNAPATSVLMPYNDYPLPLIKTQLPEDGTYIQDGGTFYYGNKFSGGRVQEGCKLWLRWNFGALPGINIFAQLWFDDSAKLFFNGTEIEIKPTSIDTIPRNSHFNATAAIDASLINTAGPNVVAMRVLDSYASVLGSFAKGAKIGTNQLIYAGLQLGSDTSVPGKLVDENPAHMIREMFTEKRWCRGYNEADIDDASFTIAADTLYDEQFGLSMEFAEQSTVEDMLNEILRHISGKLYVHRSTGLITLKLIRNDYTIGDLLVLDESRIVKIENATRKLTGELVNSVTVTYSATPRGDQGSLTIFEEGLLQLQGGVVSTKIDYPGVTNSFIAGNLALRDLRALSTPLLSCTVYASRHAAQLHIGDAFVLNWPDLKINNVVMRVDAINVGNNLSNQVKITCSEDVFFYPNQQVIATNAPIASTTGPIQTVRTRQQVYHTCREVDNRDKGSCETAFSASAFGAGGGFNGWTEIAPGVMERNSAGPLTAGMFDDIDPFTGVASGSGYTSGELWMLNRRVFALCLAGDISGDKKYQGPYIVDDLGWDPATMTATKARMHRDPDFAISSQFTEQITFRMRNGTAYGGHSLQLASTGIVLGSTELVWTDVGTSYVFVASYDLLTDEQLATRPITLDTLDMSATMANGASNFPQGFLTLVGTPGARAIPAGPWQFDAEAVWLDPAMTGDPGSITTFGYIVYNQHSNATGETMFEVLSAQITNTTPKALPTIVYGAIQYLLELDDRFVLIPTIHTTSATPVKLWLRYNSPSLATTVKIPTPAAGTTIIVTPPAPIVVQAGSMSLDGPSKFTILGGVGNHTTAIGLPHGSVMGASMLVQIPQSSSEGTMTIRPIWAPALSATSGAVRWQVTITEMNGGAISDAGVATPWTGYAASVGEPFTVDVPYTENGVVIAAVTKGTWLRIGIRRLGTDAQDSYTGQANLLGLQIDY